MPQTNAGIYEVVLEQLYFSKVMFNVFHYLQTGNVDDEQDNLATAFDTDIVPVIGDIQNESVTYSNIRVSNLTGDLADFNLNPTEVNGDVAGAVVADFVAAAFRYNRVTKDTRNGAKRFSGMVEENILGGGFTTAYQAELDLLAAALGANISGGGSAFTPIILRKPEISAGTFVYNNVAGVSNLNRLTTQNSRKQF